MQAHFDIYLMCLEVFCVYLNPPCIVPEQQPGATGPPAHLGSVLFLGGLSQEGTGRATTQQGHGGAP